MKNKLIRSISLSLALLLGILTLTACHNKNSIVGTWIEEDSNISMTFYKDGTCLDIPIHTLTSADAVSYKVQEDGKLIFTMEWNGTMKYDKTENEEEALKDRDYYYLNGNTLIFNKVKYTKK